MCESRAHRWLLTELRAPIAVGVAEIAFGVVLIIVAASVIGPRSLYASVWSNVGIGFVAAGVVTVTLEPISRKRLHQDVTEMKKANFEAVLRGVMSEPIFEQVQEQIIRQPFLRENVRCILELHWADPAERTSVLKRDVGQYEVVNISRTAMEYEVRALEEKQIGSASPEFTKVSRVSVKRDGGQPETYGERELAPFIADTDEYTEVRLPIKLRPTERVVVTVESQSVLSDRVHIYVMGVPSVGLEMTILHDPDMAVRAFPLHPSTNGFRCEASTGQMKRWRIEGGLLPFQGLELSWSPVPHEASGDSSAETEGLHF